MFGGKDRWVRDGDRARDRRDFVAAENAYAAALRREPDRSAIWVQYGHARKENGDAAAALAAYRHADGLLPAQADAQLQIGRALALTGERSAALDACRRAIVLARPGSATEADARVLQVELAMPWPAGYPRRLRFVVLGTTGQCNASCVHCPTGKAATAHAPRGTMPMELFRTVIDGIADHWLDVTDQIAFGLFGNALIDPLVVERAAYVRARLPGVRLSVNTNGAGFSEPRHAALRDLADTVALHCESLDPEIYDALMAPLRLGRVLPKMERMLGLLGDRIVVSVPISQRNRHEAQAMRAWFLARGARVVTFDPLSSRCAEDRTVFDSLALDPQPIQWSLEILDDLVVDCDGAVLMCCQDFARLEGIGNLSTEPFREVLTGLRRHAAARRLAKGRHAA